MKKVLELLRRLPGIPVLCVGDIMLDRFMYGDATRLSPEGPIPVVRIKRIDSMPGGMGNVVRNLGEVGILPLAASVTGSDANSHLLADIFMQSGWMPPIMIRDPERPTVVKTRVIAGGQQIVRVDDECISPIGDDIESKLVDAVHRHLGGVKAVALSDYGKGVVSRRIAAEVISAARGRGIPVVVDPKGGDYSKYAGASIVTPNRKELFEAAGRSLETEEELVAAARDIIGRHDIDNLLVTRSEDGMTLVSADKDAPPYTIASVAREVADISGAGDTVVALMAASLGAGAPPELGAKLATLAAGVVVGKIGTAVASPSEIETLGAICESLFPDETD